MVVGTILATLTGLAINALLTPEQVADWGWRLAFGLGGLLGLYALVLRRSITESEHFTAAQQTVPAPGEAPRQEPGRVGRGLLTIFLVSAGGSLMFYTWLIYLPTHAQRAHGMAPTATLSASLIAQVVFLAAILAAGLLGDRIGRRPMVIAFGVLFMVLPIPLFRLLDGSFGSFLVVQTVALLAVAVLFGVNGAVWTEALPIAVRAKGVATVLSLATAIFGGTAPYLITWLTARGWNGAFPVYLMAVAAATALAGLIMKESKDVDLAR